MKINLYYVYDTINETAVTGIIPVNNNLTAALGFRDSYIKNKKSPYNYQQLNLVLFGFVNVDENGCYTIPLQNDTYNVIKGKEIMDFITSEFKERGIDDNFVDNEEEQ